MACSSDPTSCSLILAAVNATLNDPSFTTGSEVAADALKAAKILKDWCVCEGNRTALTAFSAELVKDLEGALSTASTQNPLNREKIWRSFFRIRCSGAFTSRWVSFLRQAGAVPTPTLYQHLADLIFQMLIRRHYELSATHPSLTSDISTNEGNALRYAAGCVVRHVLKKVRQGNAPHKDDLIDCCQRLVKTDLNNHMQGAVEEWTDLVDRGGLCHVKETTFQLFCALEDEVRKYLNQLSLPNTSVLKEQFVEALCSSEDVEFYWIITTADFEVDDADVHEHLLRMIADLFVTVRGFSYANAWIELYKQVEKKSTQRSKSLRKKLYTDDS